MYDSSYNICKPELYIIKCLPTTPDGAHTVCVGAGPVLFVSPLATGTRHVHNVSARPEGGM